jgi:hypothetical protein
MSKILMIIDNLIEGKIVKRPSKIIKSPYVADILPITSFDNNMNETKEILGHTASLGCCGLADTGATILMTKIKQIFIETKLENKGRKYFVFLLKIIK